MHGLKLNHVSKRVYSWSIRYNENTFGELAKRNETPFVSPLLLWVCQAKSTNTRNADMLRIIRSMCLALSCHTWVCLFQVEELLIIAMRDQLQDSYRSNTSTAHAWDYMQHNVGDIVKKNIAFDKKRSLMRTLNRVWKWHQLYKNHVSFLLL